MSTRLVTKRFSILDCWRGLAVVLMVLDHVLAVLGAPVVTRLLVTRLSLPLFCATSGALHLIAGPRSPRRSLQLLGVALLETVLNLVLGLGVPGPVTLMLVMGWVGRALRPERHGLVLVVVGVLQAVYLPVPWTGYQPGLVLAWWSLGALGVLAEVDQVTRFTRWCPRWLEAVGRRPLGWYVGHLLVLAVVVGAVR